MDDFDFVGKILGSMDQGLGGGQACLEVRAGEDDTTLAAACQGLEETPGWWHEGSDYTVLTDGPAYGRLIGSIDRLSRLIDVVLLCCSRYVRTSDVEAFYCAWTDHDVCDGCDMTSNRWRHGMAVRHNKST